MASITIATYFATTLSFVSTLPSTLVIAAIVAAAFFAVDTITGIIAAILRREVSSSQMRTKLVSKMAQYATLLTLGAGASLLATSWVLLTGAVWAIIAIETVSLTENLDSLEKNGVNMGPARPFLAKISQFLASTNTATKNENTAINPKEKNHD